ncbi:MAG: hypothetical protein E7Z89_06600 [Cyanobacteria bacterium SIG28]|nr:hypothetical protein [Cyanobacteria bacterium SIG28]
MGLNITQTMTGFQFENKENLRNAAKNILENKGASQEATQKIIEKTIFDNNTQIRDSYINPQMSIIKASAQITINDSLKETLKYLKNNAHKKITKEPVLGELWNLFSQEEVEYKGELCDYVIDENATNIFIAA